MALLAALFVITPPIFHKWKKKTNNVSTGVFPLKGKVAATKLYDGKQRPWVRLFL